MNDEQTVFIPPVQLESLADFKEVAGEAAVIVYNPEYFRGPFTDDDKRIRRLTLSFCGWSLEKWCPIDISIYTRRCFGS
ncbi:MAG: hypothetical protein ACXAAK_14270 [Candidatus Thorarchaeota archaeon]|jgi:hypothetical protein